MKSINEVQWAFLYGTSDIFDDYKVRFGKSLTTGERIAMVKPLSLFKSPETGRLFVFDKDGQVGSTSPIVDTEWVENTCVGDEQVALAKCFMTQSGSKYYFAPASML